MFCNYRPLNIKTMKILKYTNKFKAIWDIIFYPNKFKLQLSDHDREIHDTVKHDVTCNFEEKMLFMFHEKERAMLKYRHSYDKILLVEAPLLDLNSTNDFFRSTVTAKE